MVAKTRMTAAQLVDAVNKKFGAGTMIVGTEAGGLVKPRLSTGSFALDLVLDGGFPEGAIEVMEGDEGSSKSWNLHRRAANFLAAYPESAYILINAEGTNDPPFLEMLGVDLSRTYFIQPDSGEQAWDVAHYVAEHAAKVYVGVDSLDQMVPLAEMEGDMDESKMAPAARMNNRGFRKLVALMKSDIATQEHRITMGIVTQLRTNIGVMFGDNSTSVGGRGKKYAAMTIIRYRRKKILRTEGPTLADRVAYGLQIEAEVIKNKGVGQGERVEFTLYKENFDGFKRGQIDNVTELIPFILKYELVQKSSGWYKFPDGHKVQGENALAKYLREKDDLRESLCSTVRERVRERHVIEPSAASSLKVKALKNLRKRLPRGRAK